MKRIITYVLFLSAALILPPILVSNAQYEVQGTGATMHLEAQKLTSTPSEPSASTIEAFVQTEAIKYHVNPNLANCIVSHESQWIPSKIGDIGNPKGDSVGLWQISISQHNDITTSEALNYEQATDWALSKIAAGHVDWWSTVSARPFYCRDVPVF